MAGPLGYALLSTILQVSWGYAAIKASKAALSSLDHMASMVGSHLCVLYPSVKGWEGTEARTRWAGRGATGNPPWIREIRASSFNSCVSCRHNSGPFPFPRDPEWASYFRYITDRHRFHTDRRGDAQPEPPPPPGFTARSASSHSPHPPIPSPKDAQYLATHWLPVWEETLRVLRKRRSLWTKTRSQSTTQEPPSFPVYVEIPKKKKVNPEVHAVEIFLDTPHGMPGEWPSLHTPSRNRRRTPPPPIPVSPGTVKVRITGPKPTSTSDYTIALPETPPGRGRPPPPDRRPTKLNRETGEEAGKTPTSTGNEPQKGNRHGTGALSTPPQLTQTRPPSPWTGPGSSTGWNQSHLTADQRIVLLKYVSGGRPRVFHELVGPGESIEKTDDGTGKGTGKTDDPTPLPNKEKDRLQSMGRLGSYLRDTRGLSSTTR